MRLTARKRGGHTDQRLRPPPSTVSILRLHRESASLTAQLGDADRQERPGEPSIRYGRFLGRGEGGESAGGQFSEGRGKRGWAPIQLRSAGRAELRGAHCE